MVFRATTFGLFLQMLPTMGDERDPWIDRMVSLPTTVISSTPWISPVSTGRRR